jgi:hypothetical protein
MIIIIIVIICEMHFPFITGAVCIRATYGLNDNRTVSILNEQRIGSPEGRRETIAGPLKSICVHLLMYLYLSPQTTHYLLFLFRNCYSLRVLLI